MKNIKKLYFIAILLFAVVLTISSCKKDDDKSTSSTGLSKYNLTVVNGRIVFPDQTTFDNVTDYIYQNQLTPEKIKDIYGNCNFTSMIDVYNIGMSKDKTTDEFSNFCEDHPTVFSKLKDDESLIYELQIPITLAYIANENGIYQVGQKIIRVTSCNTLIITNGDESKIPMLMEPINSITDPSIQIESNKTKGEYSYRTAYFDNKHRIVARLTSTQTGGYWYYEARTTAQNKGWTGIWTQENINVIRIERAAGYFTDGIISADILPLIIQYAGQSDISMICGKTIQPVIMSESTCLVTHIGTRGNVNATIANNEVFPN